MSITEQMEKGVHHYTDRDIEKERLTAQDKLVQDFIQHYRNTGEADVNVLRQEFCALRLDHLTKVLKAYVNSLEYAEVLPKTAWEDLLLLKLELYKAHFTEDLGRLFNAPENEWPNQIAVVNFSQDAALVVHDLVKDV